MAAVYPVIMCGGVGSRLWPLSRKSRPKQFLSLLGDLTLFQHAVERVRGVAGFERLIVITGSEQAPWVVKQLDQLGVDADIVLEPEGRDSAPAVAVAAAHVEALNADGVVIIVPSDHHIPDPKHFQNDLDQAVQNAEAGNIVTLGIMPTEPSPAFGYILPQNTDVDLGPIQQFVEKPDVVTAKGYIADGYLWNSGSFIATATCLIGEFESFAPQILQSVRQGIDEAVDAENGIMLGTAFCKAEKAPFDIAVMEKTQKGTVLRSTINWSDLGAWDAVYQAMAKDSNDNANTGNAVFHDSHGCSVRVNNGGMTVLSSVKNLNVVVEDDVVLVSSLAHAHNMKQVVDQLQVMNRPELHGSKKPVLLKESLDSLKIWMNSSTLPLWATTGFDYDRGLWRENLNKDGSPTGAPIRGRVQGRQDYVFAVAAQNGWAGPASRLLRDAAIGGAVHLNRPDGLRKSLVDANGVTIDDGAKLYDQAFALLALAARISRHADAATDHSANATGLNEASAHYAFGNTGAAVQSPSESLPDHAQALMDAVEASFGENVEGGCFFENGSLRHLANPMMHLFEAVMAMKQAFAKAGEDASRWERLATAIASFARDTLVDQENGCIFEVYDDNWKPLRKSSAVAPLADELEPGHQLEWAWLFVSWYKISGDDSFLDPAKRLFKAGVRGINPQTAAVVNRMSVDLTRMTGSARLWPQAEWLKAALLLYEVSSADEKLFFKGHVFRALETVMRYFDTSVSGLWYDTLLPDNSFAQEVTPASTLYHITSMMEQMRDTQSQCPEL